MTERDFRALSPAIAGALPKGEPLIKNNLYFVTVGADSISARFFGSIWNAPLQATFIPHRRGGACSSRKKQTTTAKQTASHTALPPTRRGAHCASAHHGADPRMRTTDGRPYKGIEHGGNGLGLKGYGISSSVSRQAAATFPAGEGLEGCEHRRLDRHTATNLR